MNSHSVLSTANKDPLTLQRELGPYHYLHTILEDSPNGVMVIAPNHDIIHANPASSYFLGAAYGELQGTNLEEILSNLSSELFEAIREHYQSQSTAYHEDVRLQYEISYTLNEKKIFLKVIAVVPPLSAGYYLLYLIDITEQHNLQRELRRRSTFLYNLIESSVDGIIAADMKGRIILFNQAAQDLLGYDETETRNLHVTNLYKKGVAHELIKRMRSDAFGPEGKLLRHELIVKHKDGHEIPVSFSGGIIYDRKQEIATFGLFTDLRALQQIEEDLEQTHKMLMQSEKMAGLGRLAAGVAHEINNPMSGIMLYANFIQEELGENNPVQKDLETIIHEAERCKVIVADLLEFSHQTTYEMERVNLNEVIQKTLTILQHQPLFQNIGIIRELDPQIPPVYGNSIRLNQVIMNMVVNAAQAMEGDGQLTIISRSRANHDINEILIKDTGPGIDNDLLEKIFDPFFTTKATGEGTGLGLSVSYAIIKEHKGSIRVTSSPDAGTTFTLRFPVVMENSTGVSNG